MAIKPLQSITLKNDNGEDTTYVVASAPAIVETTEPASVASFADGAEGIPVSSLIADINPVQNLNGQSAPYPAGGGKNLYDMGVSTTTVNNVKFTRNADGSYTTSGTATANALLTGEDITLPAGSYICSATTVGTSSYNASVYVDGVYQLSIRTAEQALTLSQTSSVRFVLYVGNGQTPNITFYPMIRLSTIADSTYAPYSNICPITGWTGMNVKRTGANLWDEEWEHGYWSSSDGTKGGSSNQIINKNPIYVKPSTTYKVLTWQLRICQYKADGTFISATNVTNTTFTTDAECAYINFNTFNNNYGASDYRGNDIAILYPSTLTTYEPYNGTTYPISWADEAGTVYGGTLDVTTGLLTVDRAYVDFANISWNLRTTGSINRVWSGALPSNYVGTGSGQKAPFTASAYSIGVNTTASGLINAVDTLSPTLRGLNTTSETDSIMCVDSKERENPIGACVYELATPQTYQLTPQAVLTVLGQNNIWADTGDVEVAYCADTKMYIDKVISEL